MKVICLVPSISETLLACGIDLVGRSRFCIHPQDAMQAIPKVGGTKDIDWQKCESLTPDLIILDKEENTLAMAESCPYEYFALHITSIDNIASELSRLASRLNNNKLKQVASRWQQVADKPLSNIILNNIPGVIDWWSPVTTQTDFIYLIWRDPWMAIGQQTFIQSLLDHCGLKKARVKFVDKYPQIDINHYSPEETLLLFSSEPYPFERYQQEMLELGFCCALIDGEKFSWYGIRSLEFLESLQD